MAVGCVLALAGAARAQTPDLDVVAIPEFTVAHPGSTLRVAVRLSIPEGWHIGWVNPGPRGVPSSLSWRAEWPVTPGSPTWPFPALDTTGLTANVYHGDVIVLTPFILTGDARPGTVTVNGRLTFGLCRDTCVRQERQVTASFRIDTAAVEPSSGWIAIEAASAITEPIVLRARFVRASFERDSVRLTILLPGGPPTGSSVTFFPREAPRAAVVVPVHTGRDASWLRLALTARDGIGRISGVLVAISPWGADGPVALSVDTHVKGRP